MTVPMHGYITISDLNPPIGGTVTVETFVRGLTRPRFFLSGYAGEFADSSDIRGGTVFFFDENSSTGRETFDLMYSGSGPVTVEFIALGTDEDTGEYFYEILPLIHITWSVNPPTATPTATATSVAAATATPTRVAPPTQTPTATPTPTATATATSTPTPTAAEPPAEPPLFTLLSDLTTAVYADEGFRSDETDFLDCMERLTDERPDSFDAALGEYSGDFKTAFDACDDETDILDTYHDVSVSELRELTTAGSSGASGTSTRSNKYTDLLDNDAGRDFMANVGDPDIVKEFAFYHSKPSSLPDPPAQGASSNDEKWQYVLDDCIPDPMMLEYDNATPEQRIEVLNCVAIRTPTEFWMDEQHDRVLRRAGDWLASADDECTSWFTPDVFFYACDRHDIAYDTLQVFTDDGTQDKANKMDDAWNPRNKILADNIFREEIARHGCRFRLGDVMGWPACADIATLANIYHTAVANINNKGWPYTNADVDDTYANGEYTICQPPTLDGVTYARDGWLFTAILDPSEICVDGLEIDKYIFEWGFIRRDDTVETVNQEVSATHTRVAMRVPEDVRSELASVTLLDFKIRPIGFTELPPDGHLRQSLIEHLLAPAQYLGFWLYFNIEDLFEIFYGGVKEGDYLVESWRIPIHHIGTVLPAPPPPPVAPPVPPPTELSTVGDVRLSRTSMNQGRGVVVMSRYAAVDGERVELRYPDQLSTSRNCSSRGGTWSSSTGAASTYSDSLYGCEAGTMTVELYEMPDDTLIGSADITIIGATPTPTPTPTPTRSGTLVVCLPGEMDCQELEEMEMRRSSSVRVEARNLQPSTLLVDIVAGGVVATTPECLLSSTRNEPRSDFEEQVYACNVGSGEILLLERQTRSVLGRIAVTVVAPATATPTPTPTPITSSAELDARPDVIVIGQSTDITGEYTVPRGSVAAFSYSEHLKPRSDCADEVLPDGQDRTSGSVRARLYGCSAGPAWAKLTEKPNGDVLATVEIEVVAPAATPTPTPTITPTLVPPNITGFSLSGTRLRVDYTRPTGTSYYNFRIYRSYYGENDFSQYDTETDRSSPVYFSGLPRGYTYYVRGQSCRDGSYSECDGLGDSSSSHTVPTATPTPEPCEGTVTVSTSSVQVRGRVDVSASYSDDCPDGVSLDWSTHLSTSSRCGPDIPRSASTEISRTLYGCVAGRGTVWLIDDSNNDTLDSVRVTVRNRPTATPTPTDTPVPPCNGSVTVSDSSIEVRERVDVDATYSGDCPSGVSLEWSTHLSTSSRCGPDIPRSASTEISRRLYGCIVGTGTVWLIDDANDDALDSVRVTVRNRPTATPTATSTPVPSTGSLSSSRSSISIGQSSRVTARYTLGTNATEARLSITSHVSVDSSCPGRSDTEEHVLSGRTRAVDNYTLYGCTAGTATVRLFEMPGREELARLTIRVTAPPTPTPTATATPVPVPAPTNLRSNWGQTWAWFSWTAPPGYSRFEVEFDGDDSTVNGTSKTFRNLIGCTTYDFEVWTKKSDGTLSGDSLSTSVTTDPVPGDICFNRASAGEALEYPLSTFGDGMFAVNTHIEPGTYVMGDDSFAPVCLWERTPSAATQNQHPAQSGGHGENVTVVIHDTDETFYSSGCGTWIKQS